MKQLLLTASLLLATLSALPSASADVAVDPCDQQAGYEQCDADVGPCRADVRYYQHDAFFTVGVGCLLGNAHCGYYSHGVYGHWTGYDCEYIGPSAAAQPCPVDHTVSPGYVNIDVACDPLVNCHVNNVEDSTRTCVSDTAGCAEQALGLSTGTQYTECDDAACATLSGPVVAYVDRCVLPGGAAAPAAASGSSGTNCQEYPGYERCDYTVGTCTVTTYYFYHDAFYVVDGPHCDKPGVAAASTGSGSDCQDYPGYTRCAYTAGPCTVTTTSYHHDGLYAVEVCGIVSIDQTQAASSGTVASSGTNCQEHPGYERCDYAVGPCTVTTYYFYHDAFYRVDGPSCEKPAVASASEPLQCWGTDGLLACEATADPCHAGFRYERGEVEDVHAQCFS